MTQSKEPDWRDSVQPQPDGKRAKAQPVVVVDLDISFGAMLWLLVKFVAAAILVGAALAVIGAIVATMLGQPIGRF